MVVRKLSLATYRQLFTAANLDIVVRTTLMAAAVTVAAAVARLPTRLLHGAPRQPRAQGAALPRGHPAAVVELPGARLLLEADPGQGGHPHLAGRPARAHCGCWTPCWRSRWSAARPCPPPTSGTFLVFLYVWLPFMVLPIVAALERVPRSLVEASADLGATPAQTFRRVVLPLAVPGRRRRLDLHLLAHPRRLHHPGDHRRLRSPSSARPSTSTRAPPATSRWRRR